MTTIADDLRAAADERERMYREAATYLAYDPATGAMTWAKPYSRRTVGANAATNIANGYKYVWFDRQRLSVHRLAWVITCGEYPPEIDHINHDRQDNRLANLRAVSRVENCSNMRTPKHNTSGHKGVSFAKEKGQWQVRLYVGKKLVYSGLFDTAEEAATAYRIAAKHHRADLDNTASPFLTESVLRAMFDKYEGPRSDLDGWRSFARFLGIYKETDQ